MATDTRIGNLELVAHCRHDELERVTAHVDVRDRLLDLRHVAGHAVAARTSFRMMRVVFDRDAMRSIGRRWSVTVETDHSGRLPELRIVVRAVCVVTGGARDAPLIHEALDEVVALHAVF